MKYDDLKTPSASNQNPRNTEWPDLERFTKDHQVQTLVHTRSLKNQTLWECVPMLPKHQQLRTVPTALQGRTFPSPLPDPSLRQLPAVPSAPIAAIRQQRSIAVPPLPVNSCSHHEACPQPPLLWTNQGTPHTACLLHPLPPSQLSRSSLGQHTCDVTGMLVLVVLSN